MLACRYEHRIRRREDLLFSFGSERGPGFPKDGPGHLGCRPSFSPAWRISPGCPWIDNIRGFGIRFDNTFLLLLHGLFVSFAFAFASTCRISTSTVFSAGLQEQSVRGTDTFSVLAHSFSPFVSHFDTHFLHLGDSPVLCGRTQSYGTHLHAKAEITKQLTRASTWVPVLCDSSTDHESPAWCSSNSSQTTELHPSSVF